MLFGPGATTLSGSSKDRVAGAGKTIRLTTCTAAAVALWVQGFRVSGLRIEQWPQPRKKKQPNEHRSDPHWPPKA